MTLRTNTHGPARTGRWRQGSFPPAGVALCAVFLAVVAGARGNSGPAEPVSAPTTAPAEDSEDLTNIDLYQLQLPMVVTASRREQAISTVPYAMSVITADDIRQSGARSVPDALRLVPGVDVAELSYGNDAVSVRGFHSLFANKTLVLVDGRQIYHPMFGGTLWGNWPFQLEDIGRIEVIRGPAGVTWGPNAANGVINIITKDPKDQPGLTVSGGGGSRGMHKEYAGYGFQMDKLRMRVSTEYEGSDGFNAGGSLFSHLHDDYQDRRANVHAIYDAGPSDTLTLSGGTNVLEGLWPAVQPPGQRTNDPESQANFILGKWDHRIADDNAISLTSYVNDFYQKGILRSQEVRSQQIGFELSHTYCPAGDHTLTWGLDSRWDLTSTANADPYMLSQGVIRSGNVGVYAQDEWRFAPRWALNLGGRMDYDFYGGFQPSGRLALSYQPTEHSLAYGAVSRAFHMPPAAERFFDIPAIDPIMHVTSARGLDPETLITYELGYRARFFDRLDMGLNGFWNHYADVIEVHPRLGPPGLLQLHTSNGGAFSTYGAEAEARYAVTRAFHLFGNYTFEIPDSSTSLIETLSVSPPKHKFMIGGRYSPCDDLHLSAHLYYVDAVKALAGGNPILPVHVPQYFRLDLRGEYEFWKDRASVAVGVRNLLDDHHPEGGNLAMDPAEAPRMVYAELRMTPR